MKKFGERLKELRTARGMTQGELAEEFGIARNSIFSYETDKRTPDIEVLEKCASFFGVTSDYLLGLSDNKTTEYASIGDDLGLSDEAIEHLRLYNRCIELFETLSQDEKTRIKKYLFWRISIKENTVESFPMLKVVLSEFEGIEEKYEEFFTVYGKLVSKYPSRTIPPTEDHVLRDLPVIRKVIDLLICETELLKLIGYCLGMDYEKIVDISNNSEVSVEKMFTQAYRERLYLLEVEDKLENIREKIKGEED